MRSIWRILLVMLFVTAVAQAQVDRGSITGTVSDPSGAVVPGVTVTVVETATGVHYQGDTTSGEGYYRILNLPVGQYSLTFVREGFKTLQRQGVQVAMSQNVTLNAKLNVGSRVENVTVNADASLLNTEDQTLGSTITGEVLTELPLSADGGRDARNYARSVVATFSTVTGPQLGYNNSVAGLTDNLAGHQRGWREFRCRTFRNRQCTGR